MARHLLTAFEIKTSQKAKLRDGDGLWLHRNKSGSQSWVFIYIRGGKRREMGLGSYGSGTGQVTLGAARQKANEIREILGAGGDPFADLPERKRLAEQRAAAAISGESGAKTFGQVVDDYVAAMSSKWRGKATHDSWARFSRVYTAPISGVPMADLATEHVLQIIEPMWYTLPETAAKVRARMRAVWGYAKTRGLARGDNPAEWRDHLVHALPPPKKLQKGHHAAAPYTEVPAIVKGLREVKGVGARALEFTILTAARSGETRGAVFDEFDLDTAIWTVPPARMKAGKEHRVALCERAVTIVKEMAKERQSNFVFPGAKRGSMISDMTMAKSLKAAGGAGYTCHGFRSSFRDWVSDETDHQREVAEAALAHAVGDVVERAYRRGDALAKRRALMDDWAAFVGGGNG